MKNDLLWERLFSLAIVLTMITSSFAGLMIIGFSSSTQGLEQSQLPNGDLIIGSDYEIDELTISGSVHYMDGNLEIRKGGTLIVDNGGLSFTQDTGADGVPGTSDDRVYSLTVEDGGKLIVRNSTITTRLNLIYDFPSLGFIAQNGAFIELNDSTLQFPGFIVVDNSTFTMRNSTIKGHDSSDISNYCKPTYFPPGAFDDSAVLLLSSSDVHLYDSNIEDVFEDEVNYSEMYVHNYPFASDTRDRDLVNYTLSRNPQELGAGNDCTGESLINLTMDDLLLFTVEPGKTLGIDKIDMAGLQFDAANVTITLNVNTRPIRAMPERGPSNGDMRTVEW